MCLADGPCGGCPRASSSATLYDDWIYDDWIYDSCDD